jgi:hypothetical protein
MHGWRIDSLAMRANGGNEFVSFPLSLKLDNTGAGASLLLAREQR